MAKLEECVIIEYYRWGLIKGQLESSMTKVGFGKGTRVCENRAAKLRFDKGSLHKKRQLLLTFAIGLLWTISFIDNASSCCSIYSLSKFNHILLIFWFFSHELLKCPGRSYRILNPSSEFNCFHHSQRFRLLLYNLWQCSALPISCKMLCLCMLSWVFGLHMRGLGLCLFSGAGLWFAAKVVV